jgi:GT2 family glycosyltransferase
MAGTQPGEKMAAYDLSVIIVSYNTRDVLRRCFQHLDDAATGLALEIIVVDNGSKDGSVEMLTAEYPHVRVISSAVNLGFGAANNRALEQASGRYIILLNSDAFLRPDSLQRAIAHMDSQPEVGLGGGRLIGQTETWQPSARCFPSLLNEFLCLSGLASRYPKSKFFGRFDRTWSEAMEPAEVDWVPGAFSIIRPDALKKVGFFDEDFFLYYEEVDLCRRFKAAGYKIQYWPDVVIVHLGGESSKTVSDAVVSRAGSQLTLWRMRSELLYYRKHHGGSVFLAYLLERLWYEIRAAKNGMGGSQDRKNKAAESRIIADLMKRAWKETRGGRVSPPRPW